MAFFVLDNATDKAGRMPSMKKYVHRNQQEKKKANSKVLKKVH